MTVKFFTWPTEHLTVWALPVSPSSSLSTLLHLLLCNPAIGYSVAVLSVENSLFKPTPLPSNALLQVMSTYLPDLIDSVTSKMLYMVLHLGQVPLGPVCTLYGASQVAPYMGLPRWCSGKESACQGRGCRKHGFNPWVRTILWRKKWQPTAVFLPKKLHGQRSLAGYCPWGHKELDMTEHRHHYIAYTDGEKEKAAWGVLDGEEPDAKKHLLLILQSGYPTFIQLSVKP